MTDGRSTVLKVMLAAPLRKDLATIKGARVEGPLNFRSKLCDEPIEALFQEVEGAPDGGAPDGEAWRGGNDGRRERAARAAEGRGSFGGDAFQQRRRSCDEPRQRSLRRLRLSRERPPLLRRTANGKLPSRSAYEVVLDGHSTEDTYWKWSVNYDVLISEVLDEWYIFMSIMWFLWRHCKLQVMQGNSLNLSSLKALWGISIQDNKLAFASEDLLISPASYGRFIRDPSGAWMLGFTFSIGTATNMIAELMAIWTGLQLAWDRANKVAKHLGNLSSAGMLQQLQILDVPPPIGAPFLATNHAGIISEHNVIT
ncbi:hypothetical protein Scep_016940 [Stephania cephalantha]|uniref:RNase H type-1 domain-containing protein n=1 Tax=Stephania cephalantha TaxID=152367 RepID=A0AAP0IQJ4_9MAGN